MKIHLDTTGSVTALETLIRRAASEPSVRGLLVLACDANGFAPEAVSPVLRRSPLPLVGGVFPALIHGEDLIRRGSLVLGLSSLLRTAHIPGLSDPEFDYEGALAARLPDTEGARSMLVLVDGFAKRIGAFIEALFNRFGLELNYIGGGAGSLTLDPSPCLLTNEGMARDGAVLALLSSPCGVGVCHGWETLSGPFRVTEADRNVIRTLDWRPAFEVYREVVAPHAGRPLDADDFFRVAKAYPFGISRLGSEQVVRDPVRVREDGGLICVGEVPEGAFVSILHGDDLSLIRAAGEALRLGCRSVPGTGGSEAGLVMDCISRVLFLEDRFEEELAAINQEGRPMVGACTIGEIANCGEAYLEFYNKTAVVAVLGDP